MSAPSRAATPVLVIPDTTPLIHLASAGLLHVLTALGRVIVPDVIALEATRLPDKPGAAAIAAWLATGPEVVETDLGDLYRLAIETGRRPPRDVGELSILRWLLDEMTDDMPSTVIVYEDKRVPRLLEGEPLPRPVRAVTTRALLEVAASRGLIPSEDDAWAAVIANSPTASPASLRRTFGPKP